MKTDRVQPAGLFDVAIRGGHRAKGPAKEGVTPVGVSAGTSNGGVAAPPGARVPPHKGGCLGLAAQPWLGYFWGRMVFVIMVSSTL